MFIGLTIARVLGANLVRTTSSLGNCSSIYTSDVWGTIIFRKMAFLCLFLLFLKAQEKSRHLKPTLMKKHWLSQGHHSQLIPTMAASDLNAAIWTRKPIISEKQKQLHKLCAFLTLSMQRFRITRIPLSNKCSGIINNNIDEKEDLCIFPGAHLHCKFRHFWHWLKSWGKHSIPGKLGSHISPVRREATFEIHCNPPHKFPPRLVPADFSGWLSGSQQKGWTAALEILLKKIHLHYTIRG